VFSYSLVEKGVKQEPRQLVRKIAVSVDPAGMGDDEQVIYAFRSGHKLKEDIRAQCRGPMTASLALQVAKDTGANMISIECDGMGQPIADFIRTILPSGIELLEVHAASTDCDQSYANVRAAMWFYAKEEVEDGREKIPDDPDLCQELVEMKYFINRRGQMQLEDKDDLKERIGRSPNRADAWVQNVWARKFSAVVKKRDAWSDNDMPGAAVNCRKVSAMEA
jgi:hypothetical protein